MDVFGLPLHPLVVHAAVVLVPLTMVGALAVGFWRAARRRFGSLVLGLSVVSAVSVFVARASGTALKDSRPAVPPIVDAHEAWGSALVWPSVTVVLGIGLVLIAQWFTTRPEGEEKDVVARARLFHLIGIVVTVASAITGLTLVVLTGHSGATAVWG